MSGEGSPMKLDIKLGYACNNDCIHCVVADNRRLCLIRGRAEDLTTEECRHELLESHGRGFNVVVFTGGEPTVRNDFPHLMHYAHGLGYRVDVQTNGRKFASRPYAQAVGTITRASFCVALHAHERAVHDTVTSVPGSFKETVAGIRNLVGLGQEVVGKVVISKVNAPCLEKTCRLYCDLGVHDITLTFPHAMGNAMKYFDDVVPRYHETLESLRNALDYSRSAGITTRTEAYPLCLMEGYEEHCIEFVFADEKTEIKQLGHQDYTIDWSVKRLENKGLFIQCGECRYELICEGPWREYPENRGSREFRPVPGQKLRNHGELLDYISKAR
jgi:MoaA/NifB/PqqE/SkfB family radical SAM enzyme